MISENFSQLQESLTPYIVNKEAPCSVEKNETVSFLVQFLISMNILKYFNDILQYSYKSPMQKQGLYHFNVYLFFKCLEFVIDIIILRDLSLYNCSFIYSVRFYIFYTIIKQLLGFFVQIVYENPHLISPMFWIRNVSSDNLRGAYRISSYPV